jgi:hypothetical protein
MQSTTERRKHERFSLVVPAQLETTSENKTLLSLHTSNIGAGGAYFPASAPLPRGTRVKVSLLLPLKKIKKLHDANHAVIIITGTIVRSEAAGMSMTFDKPFEIMTRA